MKRLLSFPSYYLEIIVLVIMNTDRLKGSEVFLYFFPPKEQNISVEEYAARWEIVHVEANEVGFEEIQKVLKKVIKVYRKVGGGKVLSEQATYEIVTERLRKSRQATEETKLFNQFIQAVIEKVKA